MALFHGSIQHAAEAIAALAYTNPWLPERAALEHRALGAAYRTGPGAADGRSPNAEALAERARELVERAHAKLVDEPVRARADLELYQSLLRFDLQQRGESLLGALAQAASDGGLRKRRVASFKLFRAQAEQLGVLPGERLPLLERLPHLFALLFQQRRALSLLHAHVPGEARAVQALRAEAWHSIFGHDLRRREVTQDVALPALPTLIRAPLGEDAAPLAQALAGAAYVPFDEHELRFTGEPTLIVHCAADLAPGELARALGHGADDLESVEILATSFIDELCDLDPAAQRAFASALARRRTAVGDAGGVHKWIAATRHDPEQEARRGRLREDLVWELCADSLVLPPLAAQLAGRPEDLLELCTHAVRGLCARDHEDAAAHEVARFVEHHLPRYAWPGGRRELWQCARSVLVHGRYNAPQSPRSGSAVERLAVRLGRAELSADALLDAYVTIAYHRTGSYQEAARQLGLDRRTIKSRIDGELLDELRREARA
jgi:hypothetical protein